MCSLHDGIELEKREIPVAVICTDLFISSAKAQAAISGIPSYPFVIVPHPISRLGEDGLKEIAKMAESQVVELLLNN